MLSLIKDSFVPDVQIYCWHFEEIVQKKPY